MSIEEELSVKKTEVVEPKSEEKAEITEQFVPKDEDKFEQKETIAKTEATEKVIPKTTEDELKSIWEEKEFKSRDEFMTHYDGLSKSIEQKDSEKFAAEKDYLGQIQDLKDKQTMYGDDDDLVRLNILKNREDKSEYNKAANMLFGNTDPMQVLVNSLKSRYKDFDDDDIKEVIKKKYNLDTEAPDDLDDESDVKRWKREQAMNLADMEDAAQSIISKQRDEFDKIDLPYKKPKSKEQRVIEQVNAKKEWEPYYDKSIETVGKIERTVDVGDGQTVEVVLELDDKQKEKYSKMMADYVYDNAVSATEDNAKKLGAMLREVIERDQQNALMASVGEKMNEYYSKYWEDKVTNPSTEGSPREAVQGKPSERGLEAMYKHLENN